MRREHTTPQGGGYLDWLKSLGCVFYAPLDQENGLKDLISGITGCFPSGNTNSTVTWDPALQMYVIDNQCSGYAGLWWDGLNMFPDAVNGSTLMRNVTKTILCTTRFIVDPGYNYYNNVIGIGAANNGLVQNVGTGTNRQVAEYICPYVQMNLRQGTTAKIGLRRDGLSLYTILNGAWNTQNDNDSWGQYYYTRFGQRVSLANISSGNGPRTYCAMKEVYVFAASLDLSTIRTIQGY